MDGYELARRFRAESDGAGVLLVALTGYGSSTDRDRSRQAGFDLHLIKPVDPGVLTSLVDSRT
jgi:CheY-like chemotaxis protein